jgi:hypothetical protein
MGNLRLLRPILFCFQAYQALTLEFSSFFLETKFETKKQKLGLFLVSQILQNYHIKYFFGRNWKPTQTPFFVYVPTTSFTK